MLQLMKHIARNAHLPRCADSSNTLLCSACDQLRVALQLNALGEDGRKAIMRLGELERRRHPGESQTPIKYAEHREF